MINTLVALDADLASSIALRYSCRLTELVDMNLQTIHVEEVEKDGYPPGSGWVRGTWEKGLLRNARDEISQLINTEKSSCPSLGASIVRIGDKEEELLKEIERESYDLLLEGVLYSFDTQLFQRKIRSKLYKDAPCPIILVKNLVDPGHAALLLGELQDVEPLVSTFLKIFEGARLTLDMVCYTAQKTGQAEFKRKITDTTAAGLGSAGRVLEEARSLLAKQGWTPNESRIIRGQPKEIGEMVGEEYGLVLARIPRSTGKKSLVLDLLSSVPSATLLVNNKGRSL